MFEIKIPGREIVPIESLKVDGLNPNRMNEQQRDALKENMRKFGFLVDIITNKDGVIADGQHRWELAQELGMTEVPIRRLDVSEVDRRILRQVMNKLKGHHDPVRDDMEFKFISENDGFEDLNRLLGESDKKLVQFLANMEKEGLNEDSLDVDSARANPAYKIELGEVWQLGDHRLVCGDSTKPEDVEKLMQGAKADMVFTDPPYGQLKIMNARQEVAAKVGTYKEYANHGDFDFKPVWEIIKDWECKKVIWGANHFCGFMPITSSWIVWDKRAGEHSFFSDCELAWTNLGICTKILSITWQGMIREGESTPRVHPTQKPIDLTTKIVQNYAPDSKLILDLFGGSGSTLIAAEKTNRKCYMMEIDPVYCSVIIERWEKLTGLKAKKINQEGLN